MKYLQTIACLLCVTMLSCEQQDAEFLKDCSAEYGIGAIKKAKFPSSDLEVKIPRAWLKIEFADENTNTSYFADTTMFIEQDITVSIGLSSGKDIVQSNIYDITKDIFSQNPLGTTLTEGSTKCYGEACIYRVSLDSSLMYISFAFIQDSKLRVLNLSTTADSSSNERFCALMALLTDVDTSI